ncbi:fimbrial protein [Paraburkholderia dinghuensis]|uniref:Fimbrial protein n=2 Tax=Paraburkholderia dinghuensis TaxID=2305225 RepID=A0A3N6NXL6_9BURK|nr:fimbrial protein [Paraburkholderia dinghuensis]
MSNPATIGNFRLVSARLSNVLRFISRHGTNVFLSVLLIVACIVMPMRANAQSTSKGCFKITSTTSNANSSSYTDPGTIAASWAGSTDGSGQGAFPMTINVNAPPFVPDGTLLGSAVSPAYNLGANGVGGYNPEQVLFRCSPDSAGTMYEYYSVNGDDSYGGGTDVSGTTGITATYRTYYGGIASRITNVTTGEYVTRYYKGRALTDLDKDSQGWFLVKAKNFSQYKLELFQCSTCTGASSSFTGTWAYIGPLGYVAFAGGASGTIVSQGLAAGVDAGTSWPGWYGSWPGSFAAYNTVIVRRAATCAVTNATPTVLFPTATIVGLTQGQSTQVPVTIQMQCQTTKPSNLSAFASGTAANQTALGVLAQPANAQSAIDAGLTTTGSGVTYLLSDGYGTDSSVATGVGVALSRPNGTALNFLTNQYVTTGGAKDGWDPVLNDATANGAASGGITTYTRTINATFKAFAPGVTPVTAGRYNATAQVIVRVQ